jgi:hypothetical protein
MHRRILRVGRRQIDIVLNCSGRRQDRKSGGLPIRVSVPSQVPSLATWIRRRPVVLAGRASHAGNYAPCSQARPARGARFYELRRRDLSGRSLRYPAHPGEDLLRPGMDGHPPRDGPPRADCAALGLRESTSPPRLASPAPDRFDERFGRRVLGDVLAHPTLEHLQNAFRVVVRREGDHGCVG